MHPKSCRKRRNVTTENNTTQPHMIKGLTSPAGQEAAEVPDFPNMAAATPWMGAIEPSG